jgi:hypothetical protein
MSGKKVRRKRHPGMSFGELIRKLWQPELEEIKPKVASKKPRKLASKGKRVRKG